jgi:cytochrome P450
MLTFLQGPRRCTGETFSRLELICLIAAIVANFQIDMADSRPVIPDGIIGLKPKGGLYVKLTALEP